VVNAVSEMPVSIVDGVNYWREQEQYFEGGECACSPTAPPRQAAAQARVKRRYKSSETAFLRSSAKLRLRRSRPASRSGVGVSERANPESLSQQIHYLLNV
jgi:hypothetical protein